jgi:hypothetical protein
MMDVFGATPWPGLLVWAALYVSDYYLTIACARMYQKGAGEVIRFEGSYEITPYFQKDVDRLGLFSTRFVVALVGAAIVLVLVWWLARQLHWPGAYAFLLGSMIGQELAVHIRHIRNFALFKATLAGAGVHGRIEYARRTMLSLSATEFLAFSGLFFLCAIVTWSPFVLGSAVGCLSIAVNHRKLAVGSSQRAVDSSKRGGVHT